MKKTALQLLFATILLTGATSCDQEHAEDKSQIETEYPVFDPNNDSIRIDNTGTEGSSVRGGNPVVGKTDGDNKTLPDSSAKTPKQ